MGYTMEHHARFLHALRASHAAVWAVAQKLQRVGWDVTVFGHREAPTPNDWERFSDRGDLVARSKGGGEVRIDVKGLSRVFSGRGDWPFGSQFIVNAKGHHDRANPKPDYYFIVSADLGAAGVVNCKGSGDWTVAKRAHGIVAGKLVDYYFAPIDAVTWVKL